MFLSTRAAIDAAQIQDSQKSALKSLLGNVERTSNFCGADSTELAHIADSMIQSILQHITYNDADSSITANIS